MILPITLTIAGALALVALWLGLRVSQLRRLHRVSIGHGDNPRIEARMRAHANFAEYVPLFLILLALVELAHGSDGWLWAVAILFVLGRLAHPFGMERPGLSGLRIFGIAVTWMVLLGLAACAIATAYASISRPAPITYADAARASA